MSPTVNASSRFGCSMVSVLFIVIQFIQLINAICMPVKGDFFVSLREYSPESAVWVENECKLYTSALFNASLVRYDPYTNEAEVIEVPGITGNKKFHITGIDYAAKDNSLLICATAANAYTTAPLSAPNNLLKYNLKTGAFIYNVSMAKLQEEVVQAVGGRTGGFQDTAQDTKGNSYYIASFGNVIAKVTPTGGVSTFYHPHKSNYNNSAHGFGGIISFGDKLVISDSVSQGIVTFDTSKPTIPHYITPMNMPKGYFAYSDGWYAPPKYGGMIGLWSDDMVGKQGGTAVFATPDQWNTARFLGIIPNKFPRTAPAATVQIVDSIYVAESFFADPPNRTSYPFIDITKDIDMMIMNAVTTC